MRISDWSSDVCSSDLGGIERVEVLKGPQGTLFGRNATGGAISVITKEPNRSVVEGTLGAEYGNYNSRRLKGYLSVPVTDWLAFSLSGIYYRADAYYSQVNRDMPRSEVHTSELQSPMRSTHPAVCLKKKTRPYSNPHITNTS